MTGRKELDTADRKITTAIQDEFPLVADPYTETARRTDLDISGEEVRRRLQDLKKRKVIRQISAIFDSRNMGYKSSLVAMKLPADHLAEGARVVNRHPGVSHNYARDHEFNLWFTIAVPPGENLEAHVDALHRKASAEVTRILPTLKLYKIGVKLNLEDTSVKASTAKEDEGGVWNKHLEEAAELSEEDIAFIRAIQPDLELVENPYQPIADRLGWTLDQVFEKAEQMKERSVLRRYAAILYHRKAGFRSNGMGVWNVSEEVVDQFGQEMARFKAVSHCYRRPKYEDWKYNLFTMVHAESDDACRAIIEEMSKQTGLKDYTVLFSTTEFKKTRVEYFTEENYDWLFDEAA